MSCAYGDDAAVARRIYEPAERVEWVVTPARTHIAPEVLQDERSREFIERTYRLNDWCSEKSAVHADRIAA